MTIVVIVAVAYALVAVAMWTADVDASRLRVLLSVAAVTSVAILWFPTDPTGSGQRTTSGAVHLVLAVVNFTLVFVFLSDVAEPTGTPTWLSGALSALLWATCVSFAAFLLTLLVPARRRTLVGLTERAFLVCVPLWFIAYAVALT